MPTCAPLAFFMTPVPARLKISYLQSAQLTLITIPLVAKNFFINISPFFKSGASPPADRHHAFAAKHAVFLSLRLFCLRKIRRSCRAFPSALARRARASLNTRVVLWGPGDSARI